MAYSVANSNLSFSTHTIISLIMQLTPALFTGFQYLLHISIFTFLFISLICIIVIIIIFFGFIACLFQVNVVTITWDNHKTSTGNISSVVGRLILIFLFTQTGCKQAWVVSLFTFVSPDGSERVEPLSNEQQFLVLDMFFIWFLQYLSL